MSAEIDFPADLWPAVLASQPRPLPTVVARFDLRWWMHQEGRLPSRVRLADRWGWTAGRVRTEIDHPERWRSPS